MLYLPIKEKRIRTILLFILCVATCSYGQNSSLTSQAQAKAEEFFGRMYKKCGQHYYYKYIDRMAFLYECKTAPTISVKGNVFEPRRLSEADILNRVDPLPVSWEGLAAIRFGLCRSQAYYTNNEPGFASWGKWEDKYEDSVLMWNKKGIWTIYNDPVGTELYVKDVIVPVACETVPTENKVAPSRPPTSRLLPNYTTGVTTRWWEVTIPATNGEWISVGKGPIRISLPNLYSYINIDGGDSRWSVYGNYPPNITNSNALAPDAQLGSIVAKVGKSGKPFQVFQGNAYRTTQDFKSDSNEEVFVAINDSYFGDNRGNHVIHVGGPNVCVGCPDPYVVPKDNIAFAKAVYIETNQTEEDGRNCSNPSEITDGSLFSVSNSCKNDGVVLFQNNDHNQLMEVTVKLDLQGTYNVTKIRYNPGNVQRAETWNADTMITPFGSTRTASGSTYRGAWTEQNGSLTTSILEMKFQKTRKEWAEDWLSIGEIEVIGTLANNSATTILPTLKKRGPELGRKVGEVAIQTKKGTSLIVDKWEPISDLPGNRDWKLEKRINDQLRTDGFTSLIVFTTSQTTLLLGHVPEEKLADAITIIKAFKPKEIQVGVIPCVSMHVLQRDGSIREMCVN